MPRVFVVDSSLSVSAQRATAVSVFAGIGRSDTTRWRGRLLSTDAPGDGEAYLWDDVLQQWVPGPIVAAGADAVSIQGFSVSAVDPVAGQGLLLAGGVYVPTNLATQAELDAVAALVGNATSLQDFPVSGDDPDEGDTLVLVAGVWTPQAGGGGGASDFADLTGFLANAQVQLGEITLDRLASPVYTQTQTDTEIAGLASAVAASFDALSFSSLDGQIAVGQVPVGVVTQHQAALAIGWAQITSGVPATFPTTWADIGDFTGSSLAQLATRSAGDLSSGNLTYARLPIGDGTWAYGNASTNNLIFSNPFGEATVYVAGSTPGGSHFGVGAQPLGDSHLEAAGGSGSAVIVPSVVRARSMVNSSGWATGPANPWGLFDFHAADTTLGPGSRAGMSAHMETDTGGPVGMAFWVGPGAGRTLTLTMGSDLSALFAGAVTATSFTGGLVGNASTATALQTARTINGVAFDGTADITIPAGAAAAGSLTGDTLAANVVTSSLTTIGSLIAGSVPPPRIPAGTFPAGAAYVFQAGVSGITTLAVATNLTLGTTSGAFLDYTSTNGRVQLYVPEVIANQCRYLAATSAASPNSANTIGDFRFVITDGPTNPLKGNFSIRVNVGDNILDGLTISDARVVGIPATLALVAAGKFYVDGTGGTGDTYMWESASNTLSLVAGGTTTLALTATVATITGLLAVTAGASFRTSALATNATTGHVMIPTSAGAPTGVPSTIPTGQVAFQYDSTNHKLYVYSGAWRSTAALA